MKCPGNGDCSNQGICNVSTGTCTCNPGFQGNMCQGKIFLLLTNAHMMKYISLSTDRQCLGDGNCSNQGMCDFSTGTCVCDSGFQGVVCQGKTCLY